MKRNANSTHTHCCSHTAKHTAAAEGMVVVQQPAADSSREELLLRYPPRVP